MPDFLMPYESDQYVMPRHYFADGTPKEEILCDGCGKLRSDWFSTEHGIYCHTCCEHYGLIKTNEEEEQYAT